MKTLVKLTLATILGFTSLSSAAFASHTKKHGKKNKTEKVEEKTETKSAQ